jgi:hypothetical protein
VYPILHPVSSTNKTDRRLAIAEILLNVALNLCMHHHYVEVELIYRQTVSNALLKPTKEQTSFFQKKNTSLLESVKQKYCLQLKTHF